MRKSRIAIALGGVALLLGAFQNCGKLGFSTGSSAAGGDSSQRYFSILPSNVRRCSSFTELAVRDDQTIEDVPAQTDLGVCYFAKLIGAQKTTAGIGAAYMVDADVVATDLARVLGEFVGSVKVADQQFILLTGTVPQPNAVDKPDYTLGDAYHVDVADVLIAGAFPANDDLNVAESYRAFGGGGCGIAGAAHEPRKLSFLGTDLFINPSTTAVALQAGGEPNTRVRLDVRAEACGEVGHVSDVYVVFR